MRICIHLFAVFCLAALLLPAACLSPDEQTVHWSHINYYRIGAGSDLGEERTVPLEPGIRPCLNTGLDEPGCMN